ncbi:DUF6445 family protein [Rheinheimera soli]|uniref:Uncharacterized protein n=1 Tax=Rheinheimera soli TaxID=443616 RepID=A0ABU1VZL4_9GAMM|nr:DUF6445 family protein [Rheinheimera soli]MDR7121015.1 hypothetical protein [Rheinheimera soli]
MSLFSIIASRLWSEQDMMEALNYQVNDAIRPEIIYLGLEKTPLIMIDNFAVDLSALRRYALQSNFMRENQSYYPGQRAVLPKDYVAASLNALYQLIYEVYQVPETLRLKPQMLFYALITQAENSLHPLQCMPHFDTSAPYYFALLHYLNDSSHGNTGFFRHKPTGFERVTDQRRSEYFQSAQKFIDEQGAPPQRYQVQSNEHYELYHQIPYQANRLIIYPGNLLHSSLVDKTTDIDGSPVTGRLTANMFIDFV